MTRPVPTLLVLLFVLAAGARAGDVPITWKGKPYTAATLPADVSAAQRAAIDELEPWAGKSGYRMDFDAQGRILLVTPKDRARLQDSLRVIGKTETWFDTALPAPTRVQGTRPAEAAAPAKPARAPIPEDPEAPPPGAGGSKSGSGASAPVPQSAWGSGSIEPDTLTAVLVVTRNEDDYGKLVDALAANHGYLQSWLVEAHAHTGFTLEEPLCGAYAENAAGQEEWNGDHELMNRAAQLLTLRRFGQQPNWIVQGIAWDCEIASDGLVYCFPFRKEFVFAAEHGAWPNDVKLLMKERAAKGLELAELVSWAHGTWSADKAKLAWGAVHHLIGQGQGKLSAALEEMRAESAVRNRRETGPSTWERIPGFVLPIDVQDAALKAHFGKDVMKDAGNSMRSGHVTVSKEPPSPDKPSKPGEKKSVKGR